MKFYTCKYPILKTHTPEGKEFWPIGTAFTIECINGSYLDLIPVSGPMKKGEALIMIDFKMLEFGFTEQDFLVKGKSNGRKIVS